MQCDVGEAKLPGEQPDQRQICFGRWELEVDCSRNENLRIAHEDVRCWPQTEFEPSDGHFASDGCGDPSLDLPLECARVQGVNHANQDQRANCRHHGERRSGPPEVAGPAAFRRRRGIHGPKCTSSPGIGRAVRRRRPISTTLENRRNTPHQSGRAFDPVFAAYGGDPTQRHGEWELAAHLPVIGQGPNADVERLLPSNAKVGCGSG